MNMKNRGNEKKNNRGQITIFIIIAILIIAAGVLIYLFYPKIIPGGESAAKNPQAFMQSCLEEAINQKIDVLSLKGGSISPEHYFVYKGDTIEYLCYTNEYYKTCAMQQPMLKNHIEAEIKNSIKKDVEKCFEDLQSSFEKRGYEVNLKSGETKVELLPKRIVVNFGHELTLTKESSEKYNSIRILLNNNLYELVSIANSILNMEARYGDAETTIYMNYYKDLKVEKYKQTDGTTIYILTDRNNGKKFQFASRSISWPPGYGV